MTYTNRIVRGVGAIFLMSIFSNFIAYLTRIVLARNLSPYEYGLFYSVFTFVIFFLFFRDLGLGQAVIKHIPEFNIQKRYDSIKTIIFSALSFQFLSSLLLSVILFFSADFLSKYYFKAEVASVLLQFLILYILLSLSFTFLKDILQGFQNFKIFSLIEFLKNSITLLIIVSFIVAGFKNVFVPVFANILVCPILFFILLPFVIKTFPFFKYKITDFKPITKQMFSFGLPVLATSIGGKVIGYIDTIILTYFVSLEQVGIYNVILPSALVVLHLGSAVSAVVFPTVSELWAKQDKKRISDGINLIHKYAFVLTIPAIFTAFTFSGLFISFFFGKEYISGALALQILLIGVLFYLVAGINHSILSGIGKPQIVTKIVLFSAFLNAAGNFILIPKFGIEGAAVSTSLSYFVALFLSTHQITKLIGVNFPKITWFKLTFSGIIFVLIIACLKSVLNLNPWLELIISFGMAFLIYLALVYLIKVIDINEIKKYLVLIK